VCAADPPHEMFLNSIDACPEFTGIEETTVKNIGWASQNIGRKGGKK